MDIRELYSGLRRIQNRGETGNAYSGCGTVDEDRDVSDPARGGRDLLQQ